MPQFTDEEIKGEMRAYVTKIIGIIKRMQNGEVISTRQIAEMIGSNVSALKIHQILEKLDKKRNLKHLGIYDARHQEFARI